MSRKNKSQQTQPKLIKEIRPKTEGQSYYMNTILQNDITLCIGPAGTGKAQPYGSLVYTPQGPINIESINIGDVVCTPNGGTAKIVGIYPQGQKEVYEVTFSDNSKTKCCKEHLWTIESPNNFNGNRTWSLEKIMNYGLYTKSGKKKIRLPKHGQIYFDEQELPIDPYILGALLGDGCLRNCITITSFDDEIIENIQNRLIDGYILKPRKEGAYALLEKNKTAKSNYYKDKIVELGLFNKLSTEKFIPDIYIYNSVENRLELLRGLLDTDGYVNNNGNIEYSTSSEQLCNSVKELVQSLGGIVGVVKRIPHYIYDGIKIAGKLSYRMTIKLDIVHLFNLTKKQEKVIPRTKYFPTRYITNVQPVGKDWCVCIKLDSTEQLYLTDEFIVTHNTHMCTGLAAEKLINGEYDRIVLTRPVVGCGKKSLGALPGDVIEKMGPYLSPVTEHLIRFMGEQLFKTYLGSRRIEIAPLEYMRGSNFDNCFVILDEAQNADFDELVMFITRFGENCKMVINGDPAQTDLPPGIRGIDKIIEKCHNLPGFGIVELHTADIVRHDIVRRFLIAIEPLMRRD